MNKAYAIHLDGRREIDCLPESLLERVQQGQLVVLQNHLRDLHVHEQLRALIFSSIAGICGEDTAERVGKDGIEKIHLYLDANQLEDTYHLVREELAAKMPAITAEMFRRLGARDPFYVHSASLIRIMMPYSHMKDRRSLQQHLGKLVLHPPHHDHYQNVPTNAVNTWIAMGTVSQENGMFIYPEIWDKNLPRIGDRPGAEQYLGRPVSIALQPGDALLFHSHHLHASRLNTTNDSRIVLTNRVCLDKPEFPNPLKPQKYFISTAFRREPELARVFATDGFAGDPRKVLTSGLRRAALNLIHKLGLKFQSIPEHSPNLKELSVYSPGALGGQIGEGEIAVVDEQTCATILDGKVRLFQRHCPHEGADLALGYIECGKVVCPWHGLRFCPVSGSSNCEAIAALRTGLRSESG